MRIGHAICLVVFLVFGHWLSGQEAYLASLPKPSTEYNKLVSQKIVKLKNGSKVVVAGYKKSLADDNFQSQSKIYVNKVNKCNQVIWGKVFDYSVPLVGYDNNCGYRPVAANNVKAFQNGQNLYITFKTQEQNKTALNVHKIGLDGTLKWKRKFAFPAKYALRDLGIDLMSNNVSFNKNGKIFVINSLRNCVDIVKDGVSIIKLSKTGGKPISKLFIQINEDSENIAGSSKFRNGKIALTNDKESLLILNDSLGIENAFQVKGKQQEIGNIRNAELLSKQELVIRGVFDTTNRDFVALINQQKKVEWVKTFNKRYSYAIQSVDSSVYVVKEKFGVKDTSFVFKINQQGKIVESHFYANAFPHLQGPLKAGSPGHFYFTAENRGPDGLGGDKQLIMKTNKGLQIPCMKGQSYNQKATSQPVTLAPFSDYRLLNLKLTPKKVWRSWETVNRQFNVQCGTRLYPKARLPEDTAVCEQSSIRLSPGPDTNAFQYQWNTGATTHAITVDTSGWYRVAITHKGCTARDSIKVNFIQKRTPSLTADTTICQGDSLAVAVRGRGYPFRWQEPGDSLGTTIPKGKPLKKVLTENGTYKLYQKGYQTCAIDTLKLGVYEPPKVALADSAKLCPNDSLELNPVLPDEHTFQWKGPVRNTVTDSGVNAKVQKPGTYTLYKTSPFCPVDSLTLKHFPLPQANAGPDTTLCYNQSYRMQGSGGITYHWTPATYLSDDSVAKPEAKLPEKQAYRLTVSNQRGCSDTDRVMLDVRPPLNVDLAVPETVCANNPVNLKAKGQGGLPANYQFQWSLSNETSRQFQQRFSQDQPIKVTLTDGCSPPVRDSIYVNVRPAPEANYTLEPSDTVFLNNKLNLSTNPGTSASIQWFVDGQQIGKGASAEYTVEEPGPHGLKLIKRTTGKCADTAKGEFYGKLDFQAYIPNTFTPDGDGLNDAWRIQGSGIQSYQFRIYNRWGGLVYASKISAKPAWEGDSQFTGEAVPVGNYLYRVTIVDKAGYRHYRKGVIQVIR